MNEKEILKRNDLEDDIQVCEKLLENLRTEAGERVYSWNMRDYNKEAVKRTRLTVNGILRKYEGGR